MPSEQPDHERVKTTPFAERARQIVETAGAAALALGEKVTFWRKQSPSDPDRVFAEIAESPVSETGRTFETQRWVREAPLFHDLVADDTRTNPIRHWRSQTKTRTAERQGAVPPEDEIVELTEHEALVQLDRFLKHAAQELSYTGNPEHMELAERAHDIHTNLYYIGEKEFEEAAAGIADLWKSYLREDPKRQLCIPLGVVRTEDYSWKKSSEYLYEQIMGHFSEQEFKLYHKRITTELRRLRKDADHTRVILLDDWSISGTQLGNGFGCVNEAIHGDKNLLKMIEVNLVAASPRQIEESKIQGRTIPARAYFRTSPYERYGDVQREPLITGTHSSVDFNFEDPIEKMVKALNELHPDRPTDMPPCTNILRRQY